MTPPPDDRVRCAWPGDDALMREYHDRAGGVPLHGPRKPFQFLTLQGSPAGLRVWLGSAMMPPEYCTGIW